MRVRSKPVEYNAFQMTKERREAYRATAQFGSLPGWIFREHGFRWNEDERHFDFDGRKVRDDDWVLGGPYGELRVLTPAEFAELEVIEA